MSKVYTDEGGIKYMYLNQSLGACPGDNPRGLSPRTGGLTMVR